MKNAKTGERMFYFDVIEGELKLRRSKVSEAAFLTEWGKYIRTYEGDWLKASTCFRTKGEAAKYLIKIVSKLENDSPQIKLAI